MAIKATPSEDYPIILVPEDSTAYRDHASAIRELKRIWAAQAPADRVGYFIARVKSYVEADYEVDAYETPIPPDGDENGDGEDGDGEDGDGGDGDGENGDDGERGAVKTATMKTGTVKRGAHKAKRKRKK
jgi:hypothetical protein